MDGIICFPRLEHVIADVLLSGTDAVVIQIGVGVAELVGAGKSFVSIIDVIVAGAVV